MPEEKLSHRSQDLVANPREENIEKTQVAQQKILLELVIKIKEFVDLESIFKTTLTEISQLLNCDRIGIYRFEAHEGECVAELVRPPYQSFQGRKIGDKCFQNLSRIDNQQEQIWVVDNVENTRLEELSIKSILTVPLHQGKRWGLLMIAQCSHSRRWSQQEIEFAENVALHLSIALHQAQLLAQQQQQSQILAKTVEQVVKREKAVAAIIDKIRRSLDLNTIFRTTTEEVRQLLQADRVAVYRFNADWSGEFIIESVAPGWSNLIEKQQPNPEIPENISQCSIKHLSTQLTDTYLKENQGNPFSQKNIYRVCNDIYKQGFSPCYINTLEYYEVKAYVIVAIYEGEKLWGLLAAYQNSSPRYWEDNEINFLIQVGVHLGVALQQGELLAKTQQRKEELQTALTIELKKRAQELAKEAQRERSLSLVIDKIRRTLDINTIFQTAATEVQKLLEVEQIGIYKFGKDGYGKFICESAPKTFSSLIKYTWNDEDLKSAWGSKLKEHQPYILDEISQKTAINQNLLTTLNTIGFKSALFVPLLQGEKLWGVLSAFQNSDHRHWNADEINLLQKVATQLGMALQQTNYLRQIHTSAEQQAIAAEKEKTLSQVIDKIRRTLDLNGIFQTTVTEVRQLLKADRVAVFRFDPGSNCTTGRFVCEEVLSSFESVLAAKVTDNCFSEEYVCHYQHGKILAIDDIYQAGFSDCHLDILARFQIRANLIAPLLQDEQLWGFLCIHQCHASRQWKDSEIEFVSKIAVNLGVAIQQSKWLAQAQKRSKELQQLLAKVQIQQQQQTTIAEQEKAVFQVIEKIRLTLDLKTIFQTTVTEVRQLLQADRVAIFKFEPDSNCTQGTFVSEAVLPAFDSVIEMSVEDHCFGEHHAIYYQQGRIFAIEDLDKAELLDCHRQILTRFQIKANLVAPLLIRKQLWGLLCIHQCSTARQWNQLDKEFVSKIAVNLGVALQQAELLAQTQKRSEQLQIALAQVQLQKEHLAQVAAQEKALARIIERIRQTLDMEIIFQTTTEEVREMLKCDRVVVYRFYPDWSGEFMYESMGKGWKSLIWTNGEKTIWEDTYLQENQGGRYRYHETFAIDDISQVNLTQCHLDILEQFQVKGFVIVPVFVGEQLWGLLGAYHNLNSRHWEQREISLLTQIANQLGVGVYQAQLLNQTKHQSNILQTTLADLNAIVDNLADGLLVTDVHGCITRFNPALLSMFNLTDNLKGKHLAKVLSIELANLVGRIGGQQEEVVTAEIELGYGKVGQALATSICKEAQGHEGEQCIGSVILIRDVTTEREVDRIKTEFLATVSHELRTPLTSVLGFASLIKEKLEEVIFPSISTDDPKVHKALKKVGQNINIIVSEAERLTALINDVLDIAKMEAGRMEWKIQSTSAVEILERAIAATYPLFEKKQLQLIKNFAPNLPNIFADEDRIIQVAINLLSNAVKFTDKGSVTCRATLQHNQIVISITDTGIGIADDDYSRIFERFQQGGSILTDKPTGTGLGLPICQQIIEFHGGKIWVDSALGKGTTFFFSLPLSLPENHIQKEVRLVN